MNKSSARHKARCFAAQGLYQWNLLGQTAEQIRDGFLDQNNMAKVDMVYFDRLLTGIIKKVDEVDSKLSQDLPLPINELDPVMLAVLRLAIFELIECIDVPYAVIINEAIKVINVFGSQDSYTFLNSVLDQAAQRWRHLEYQQQRN